MCNFFNLNDFPKPLLDRATLRGREFAWQLDDIPSVIEAVRVAGYVNIGGQLQFRLKDGGTCECYEVEVNTSNILENLDRSELVAVSAVEALRQYIGLPNEFDLMTQGRAAFGRVFDEAAATENDMREAMCFVWYACKVSEIE